MSERAHIDLGRLGTIAGWCLLPAAFAVWAAVQLRVAGRVPPLSVDEAWVLLQVGAGDRVVPTLNGMNGYTGGLHLYPLSLVTDLFGAGTSVLRTTAVVMNAAAMTVFCAAVQRFWQSWTTTAIAAALLLCLPVFAAYGRLGVELTAVLPLLLAIAAWFAASAARLPQRRHLYGFLAGLFVGFAFFTHIIAVGMAAAVVTAAVIHRPRAVLGLVPFVLGAAVGVVPRFVLWLGEASDGAPVGQAFDFAPRLQDMASISGILAGLWNGPLLYLRFTGLEPEVLIPATTLTVLAAVAVRVAGVAAGVRFEARELLPPLALALAVAIIVLVTPAFSLRYFALPSALLAVTIARLFARGLEAGPAALRAASAVVIVAACGWHVAGQVRWLDRPHLESRNACIVFPLGNRRMETSCHFTDVTNLYIYLIERNVFDVVAPPFIRWPLEVLDTEFELLTMHDGSAPAGRPIAVVVYDLPPGTGVGGPDFRGDPGGLVRQQDSPSPFLVFLN